MAPLETSPSPPRSRNLSKRVEVLEKIEAATGLTRAQLDNLTGPQLRQKAHEVKKLAAQLDDLALVRIEQSH